MCIEFLNENSGAVQGIAAIVQGIATIVLVFITWSYVRLTRHLLEIEKKRYEKMKTKDDKEEQMHKARNNRPND